MKNSPEIFLFSCHIADNYQRLYIQEKYEKRTSVDRQKVRANHKTGANKNEKTTDGTGLYFVIPQKTIWAFQKMIF